MYVYQTYKRSNKRSNLIDGAVIDFCNKKKPHGEYNKLASKISPPINPRNVGKNVGKISKLCYELGLPFLSAKVVGKNTQVKGEGYY